MFQHRTNQVITHQEFRNIERERWREGDWNQPKFSFRLVMKRNSKGRRKETFRLEKRKALVLQQWE
jgi:hypothetical protein